MEAQGVIEGVIAIAAVFVVLGVDESLVQGVRPSFFRRNVVYDAFSLKIGDAADGHIPGYLGKP